MGGLHRGRSGGGQAIAARREIPLRAGYVRNGFLYAMSCKSFFRRRLLDAGLLHLDPSFRNAADADMILRLLSAEIFVHVPAYFSLFGVDGNNLTVAPGTRMDVNAPSSVCGTERIARPWSGGS